MEEKIKRVGDALWDDACHNRIADKQDWSKRLYELLDGEFPQEERVGDHVADVEDYLHNKYSFGFCDLCGDFINYDDDQWYDLGLTTPEENVWISRGVELWAKNYPDHEDDIMDVCPVCFYRLATEDGFRECPLVERGGVSTGGKSHASETMGEFLDEAGLEADIDEEKLSHILWDNGLCPLSEKYMPVEGGKMSKIKITLEADTSVAEFQKKLGLDEQGGNSPFDLMDAIIWEMDYGESATGGEPSTHNGIKIKFEEI